MCTKVPDVHVLNEEVSFIWFKEVTLNREPEAVVELNAAELTKTLLVYVVLCHKGITTPTRGGVAWGGGIGRKKELRGGGGKIVRGGGGSWVEL